MTPLNCAAARRRLNAFHDGELDVSSQIAVASHLDWCEQCARAADDMRRVGAGLRAAAPALPPLSAEEAAAFTTDVVSRSKAERDQSFRAAFTSMFADMRLVYAASGAAVAVLVCAIAMLGTLRIANDDRPDSLVMATFLATPGIVGEDEHVVTRWTARVRQANESAEQDAVMALSAVLTREGRVPTLQHLRRGRPASVENARVIEGLLDSLSRSRFELVDDRAVAPGMVWLIASTTVRATKVQPLDLPLPAPKKHAGLRSAASIV